MLIFPTAAPIAAGGNRPGTTRCFPGGFGLPGLYPPADFAEGTRRNDVIQAPSGFRSASGILGLLGSEVHTKKNSRLYSWIPSVDISELGVILHLLKRNLLP